MKTADSGLQQSFSGKSASSDGRKRDGQYVKPTTKIISYYFSSAKKRG